MALIYVMSDIHGCKDEYLEALKQIDLKDEDTLYVLGDVVDRGPDGIDILKDMMMRPNVIPLIGNHDYMALMMLRKLAVPITEENAESYLTVDDMTSYMNWINDGGSPTIEGFRKLDHEEKADIIDYLEEFSLYEELYISGKEYILVHGGLEPFVPGKPLEDYELHEMIFQAPDYSKVYFEDKILVTGHKPTLSLEGEEKGKILCKNNHIAIDCGCVYGGKLAVMCLDNGQKWYI